MGEINDVLCDYFGIAEHNADFWNSTEFYHREPVAAFELTRCDREYYKQRRRKGKATSVRRDVLMHYRGKANMLLGMELMRTIDYTIPVRIMDYDAQENKRQLRDIARQNWQNAKAKKSYWTHGGEFLTGVRKSDRILPEERFQTSLREIIAVLKRCSDKEAILEYYNSHKERFQQLDELSIEVMGVLIGRENLKLCMQEGKGMEMCKAFRDAIEEGRVEGHAEGKRERGLEDIRSLMANLKLTAQQAMDALSIPQNEQAEYMSHI